MLIDTMSIAQFITDNRIVIGSYRVGANPNMPDSHDMDHWKVTLRRKGHTMTVHFSKGYGHHGAGPTTAEVLSCLADDASGSDDHSFADWCGEYGYNEDSRTAERTWKACQHAAKRLLAFLGTDLYGQLLYSTERE